LLFETLLAWCHTRQLVKARDRQRTDSTHILAAVRALNRLEVVGETMRHALNSLAVVVPEWLRAVSPPDWKNRYARRAEDDQLPTTQAARAALALTIGHDGWRLLAAIEGTISREVRAARLRRTRSIGLARVHLGHILTAAGLNLLRLGEWFLEAGRAKTRVTPFARLMVEAPAA
jgi:hypothetical protein